jgi:hypothetical protein
LVTNTTKGRRPFSAWLLVVLVFLLAVGAIISGPMLFLAPDGHLMQWTVDQLKGTPFPDYLLPGIILFVFVGIFPLLTGIGLVARENTALAALNPFKKYSWAWTASLAVGIILEIWIITETALLGYISFLQPLMAVWGVLILALTLVPSVRKYYLVTD